MTRLELLRRAIPLLADARTVGDGAVLKAVALAGLGSDHVREALAPFRGFVADVDPGALAEMPIGSFGRALSAFCIENHISLLRPTPTLIEAADERFVAVRYAATHDMVHVLIDEGADFAGETAVYAFWNLSRYAAPVIDTSFAGSTDIWPNARKFSQASSLQRTSSTYFDLATGGSNLPYVMSEEGSRAVGSIRSFQVAITSAVVTSLPSLQRASGLIRNMYV